MLNKVFYLALVLCLQVLNADNKPWEYGIVMDGGSTHTGLYIYKWPPRVSENTTAPNSVPEQVTFTSRKPPISTCCTTYAQMQAYFVPLISFAKTSLQNVSSHWGSIPIYIKATAGMRVLPEPQRILIMGWIRSTLSNKTANPFLFTKDQAVIISGEEEGTFGWLSVNLLLNRLTSIPSDAPTYGALDMGGQSTQISFAALPSSDILEECTVMRMFGVNYRIYSHSFLTYGMNGMTSRVQQYLYDIQQPISGMKSHIFNPCLLPGFNDTTSVSYNATTMVTITEIGTGNATECSEAMQQQFFRDTVCVTGSCSILGIYQPYYNLGNITFYAFSNYAFTLEDVGLPENATLDNIWQAAQEICASNWSTFRNTTWGKVIWANGAQSFAPAICFQLTYIFTILHDAYGFPLDGTNIVFTNVLAGAQLGWTQGSMLRDANWLPFSLQTNSAKCNNTSSGEGLRAQIYYGALVWFSLMVAYLKM